MSSLNTTTFLSAANNNIPQNPSLICTHTMKLINSDIDQLDFEDFLTLPEPEANKEIAASSCFKPSTTLSPVNDSSCWDWEIPSNSSCADYMASIGKNEGYVKTMESEDAGNYRIAFRTKSGIEVMDDGYKWIKYGKKKIKNNLNPRHYYRCSTEGCKVKKRVEKEREDEQFVITTYEGKHNHQIPAATIPAALHMHNRYRPF